MRLAGRQLAKVSHNNPMASFSALLSNVESYDNLIPIVVDSIKYISQLSFDVIAYLVIVSLQKKGGDKVKGILDCRRTGLYTL